MSVKVTWYGHAALGLDIDGYQILVDPFLFGNPAAKIAPEQVTADYILISHGHGDHVGDAADIARRTGAMVISNFEIAGWMEKQGVQKTHGQHIGGGYHHPFGYLKLTLALHGSSLPDGSNGGNPAGFLITTKNNQKVYIAGDTGLFSDMNLIGQEGLDLAVIPIGDNYTMGPDDAYRAVEMLKPLHIIPVHYNTWDLIAQDADKWSERVAKLGVQVHVLKPGECLSI